MVSVIVPVYNVRNEIGRCVESLVNQTWKQMEILLIDDGSTDGSGIICDEYASGYHNVRAVHQENRGLSGARNRGLTAAEGEYILFVDSDDYVELHACEYLMEEALKYRCDIVAGKAYLSSNGRLYRHNRERREKKYPCEGIDFLTEGIRRKAMSMCAPFALYKRAMIMENRLFFEEGIFHEDELWTPQVYLHAHSVSYINYSFYYHCMREESIGNDTSSQDKHADDILFVSRRLYDIFSSYGGAGKNIVMDYICMLYLNALYIGKRKDGDKKFALRTAHSLRNLLKSILYGISPHIYLTVNDFVKRHL
ncbi:MAG: glycosyltransferase [Bacteroides fragilis]|nr:glycosyltransferase [Bacteroides fragilis]